MNEVSFVGLDPSNALREYAQSKVATLVDESEPLPSRVVLEASHHSHHGHRFRAKFEVVVRGDTVVTGTRGEFTDPYAAIDSAYDEAKRAIRERAAKREARRKA